MTTADQLRAHVRAKTSPFTELYEKAALELDQRDDTIAQLRAERDRLRKSLQDVFDLVETGQLVRNTEGDSDPKWSLKVLGLVMALKEAQAALKGETK